ncbi:hypothetical protein HG531_004203 [Fusarium graminearum]|nr:hypothetical protein HG531_004203 [Fusarium graminearum]
MSTTNLHSNNDEFTDNSELRAKGGIDVGHTHAQTNSSVCADDLEENVEQVEVLRFEATTFADGKMEVTQAEARETRSPSRSGLKEAISNATYIKIRMRKWKNCTAHCAIAIVVCLLLATVEDTGLSHPNSIESATNGSGIVSQFVFERTLRLGNNDGWSTTGWSPRIDGSMIRSRFHCSRHGDSVVVIVSIIFFQPSRAQSSLGFSWTGNPQHFIVLVSLALQNGNVLCVRPSLRKLGQVVVNPVTSLNRLGKFDSRRCVLRSGLFFFPLIPVVVVSLTRLFEWAELYAIGSSS